MRQDIQRDRSARPQQAKRRETYSVCYVDPPSDARTTLTAFFNILLGLGFSVVQMPMLPVEPGMAQLMGEDVTSPGHR